MISLHRSIAVKRYGVVSPMKRRDETMVSGSVAGVEVVKVSSPRDSSE